MDADLMGKLDALIETAEAEVARLHAARDMLRGDNPTKELTRGQKAAQTRKRRAAAKRAWDTRRKRDKATDEALAETERS